MTLFSSTCAHARWIGEAGSTLRSHYRSVHPLRLKWTRCLCRSERAREQCPVIVSWTLRVPCAALHAQQPAQAQAQAQAHAIAGGWNPVKSGQRLPPGRRLDVIFYIHRNSSRWTGKAIRPTARQSSNRNNCPQSCACRSVSSGQRFSGRLTNTPRAPAALAHSRSKR